MPDPSNSQLTRFHAIRLRLEHHQPSSRFNVFVWEFGLFVFKQAWSCLFGGLLLALVLCTRLFWPAHFWLARYDFLFLAALLIQILLMAFRLETLREAKVILMFHVIGTLMELFKTHVGSWTYPEANLFRLGHVPLFSGFMYASVGSYIARVWRALEFRYSHYPNRRLTYALALLIYVNFFTHHYLPDLRWALFAAVALAYGRTWVHYKPYRVYRRMPLLVGFGLVALFIWIAENAGTFGNIWVYPDQHSAWHLVHFAKLGAWFLLMIISFILVSLAHVPEPLEAPESNLQNETWQAQLHGKL